MHTQLVISTFRHWLVLAMLLAGGFGSYAQEAESTSYAFSLKESIEYALENNKNIQNARFDQYIAERQVKEVFASGLPQINGSLQADYYAQLPVSILPGIFNPQQEFFEVRTTNDEVKTITQTLIDPATGLPVPGPEVQAQFGTTWQSTFGFSARQLIFDGTFFLGLKAAQVYVDVAEKQLDATHEETALQVSKAYYSALTAQESLRLLDANLNRVEKLYNDTKSLFEEGFAEKIDMERLQITLTNLQLEKSKAERLAALSIDLLKFQMGMSILDELTLTEEIKDLAEAPVQSLDPLNFDYRNRVEYRLLETQYELENFNMRRFRSGYWPTLYATGAYQWNAQRNEFNFFESGQPWFEIGVIGATLSVPIFDGFRKHNQIQQSKLRLRQIANNKELLQNSIALEMRNTSITLLNSYNNLETYKRNAELAQKVFNVANIKYTEGVGSSLELNDAENQLKESETNYLNAMFDYLSARLEWQKARGEFNQYHPQN
ncbi:MAG: TolC family protein [Bacteroidota bacterium]